MITLAINFVDLMKKVLFDAFCDFLVFLTLLSIVVMLAVSIKIIKDAATGKDDYWHIPWWWGGTGGDS